MLADADVIPIISAYNIESQINKNSSAIKGVKEKIISRRKGKWLVRVLFMYAYDCVCDKTEEWWRNLSCARLKIKWNEMFSVEKSQRTHYESNWIHFCKEKSFLAEKRYAMQSMIFVHQITCGCMRKTVRFIFCCFFARQIRTDIEPEYFFLPFPKNDTKLSGWMWSLIELKIDTQKSHSTMNWMFGALNFFAINPFCSVWTGICSAIRCK